MSPTGLSRAGGAAAALVAAATLTSLPGCEAPVRGVPASVHEVVVETARADPPLPEATADHIREVLARWQRVFPQAEIPRVHIVPGSEEPPVTRAGDALRVQADAFVPGNGVGALPPDPAATLPRTPAPLVARELAREAIRPPHPITSRLPWTADPDGLLSRALREGAADFLATLITGEHPAPQLLKLDARRERDLWGAFSLALDRDRAEGWFQEEGTRADASDEGALPPGAGRLMGYRILHAFWARSNDPREALREIVAMRDLEEILERSRYAGSVPEGGLPPSPAGLGLSTWPGFECHLVGIVPNRHHACVGGDGPLTVVLESAIGADHRAWHRVAPHLATRARVIVHDRVGLGESGPAPPSRTPWENGHSLAVLLEILSGPGPYIFAGEGAGAQHIEAFAALYPWRVLALAALERPLPLQDDETELPDRVLLELEGLSGARTAMRPDALPPERRYRVSGETGQGGPDMDARALFAPVLAWLDDPEVAGAAGTVSERAEPRGCWEAAGSAVAGLSLPLIRLTPTPRGGEELEAGSHPVEGIGAGPLLGAWIPLGPRRMRLVLRDATERAGLELALGADGRWTGNGLVLAPRPCELPT
jgi:hypothetical protein